MFCDLCLHICCNVQGYDDSDDDGENGLICDWNAEQQIIQSARKNGRSFEEELDVLLSKSKITRAVGRELAFVDAHQRGLDIKRSYLALQRYAINDFKFMNDTTTLVGAKNVAEIGKKIDNLIFCESSQLMSSLLAQLGRLERYLLKGIDIFEFAGRRVYQTEFIKCIEFDISIYGFCKEIIENIMAVSAYAVNPATDLTTCRAAMATIVKRNDVGEVGFDDDNDSDFKEGKVDYLPSALSGARNFYSKFDSEKGKCCVEYNVSRKYTCVVDLKLVLFDYYNDKRNYKEKDLGDGLFFEAAIRGDEPATSPDGLSCFKCNFGTFPYCTPCRDKTEAHKKLRNCWICTSRKHLYPICRMHKCIYRRVQPDENWRTQEIKDNICRIHVPRAHHYTNYNSNDWNNRNNSNYNWNNKFGAGGAGWGFQRHAPPSQYSGRKRDRNEFERGFPRGNGRFGNNNDYNNDRNNNDQNKNKEKKQFDFEMEILENENENENENRIKLIMF